MKLKRGINKKELEELITKRKVLPKYNNIVFNNDSPIQLTLNILRCNLDWDYELNMLYAPNGYTLQDVKGVEYNNVKYDIKELWSLIK